MIKIKLEKEVLLDDSWCDKETFEDVFANDRAAFLGLLNEDVFEVIEEAGGLAGLLKEYSWEEEAKK